MSFLMFLSLFVFVTVPSESPHSMHRSITDPSSTASAVPSSSSPKPQGKGRWRLNRGNSVPEVPPEQLPKTEDSGKNKRGASLFNKKKKRTGHFNLPLMEEDDDELPKPRSPILVAAVPKAKPELKPEQKPEPKPDQKAESLQLVRPKRSAGTSSSPTTVRGEKPKIPMRPPRVLGQKDYQAPEAPAAMQEAPSAATAATAALPSPQMNYKRSAGTGQPGKKRPPPPRPLPFAKTHPTQASKLTAIIQAHKSESFEEPGEDKPQEETEEEMKKSDSVEDLFKDLQEFQAIDFPEQTVSSSQVEAEFETFESVEPSPILVQSPLPDEVVTIKVSEYKPDSTSEEDEDEEEDGNEEDIGRLEHKDTTDASRREDERQSSSSGGSPLSQKQETLDSIGRGMSPYLPDTPSPLLASGGNSPLLSVKNDKSVVERKPTPPPVPPPRQRRKPGGVSPLPSRAPPPPPRVRASQSEMNLRSASADDIGSRGLPYSAASVMTGLNQTSMVEDEGEASPIRRRRCVDTNGGIQ